MTGSRYGAQRWRAEVQIVASVLKAELGNRWQSTDEEPGVILNPLQLVQLAWIEKAIPYAKYIALRGHGMA